jgi:hypothetical protein
MYNVDWIPAGKTPIPARLLLDPNVHSFHDESDCSCEATHTRTVRSLRAAKTGSGLQLQSSWANGG